LKRTRDNITTKRSQGAKSLASFTKQIAPDVGFIFELLKNNHFSESCVNRPQAVATLPRKGGQSKECEAVRRVFSVIWCERSL
jgi:hypothetical protein